MAAPDLRAAVRHGAAHLERMAEELAELEHAGHAAGTDYAELQHRFDILGGYTLDQRVDEALSGLGFARDEWLRPPTALSGGQQTRAALARLVISDPDLMLLDEPTNHLDIGAIEWLEEHLRRRSGALLVASHDRAFLDATVTRVWELRDRRLTVFRGDYSAYHRQRIERDERAEREAESLDDADRPRDGARPALPQPAQAREDARARGAAREAQGAGARGAQEVRPLDPAPRRGARGRARPVGRARGPRRGPRGRVPAGSRRAGAGRLRGRRPRDRGEGAVPRRAARGADRDRRAQRGGQDDPAADDRRRPARAGRDRRVRPPGVALVPRPAARRGDPRRDGPRRDPRGDPRHARRGARLPRAVPVPRRRRVQGGADAVRRRAVAAGARAARDPAVEPDAPRRTHEPPRHRGARGDRGVPRGVARHAPRRVPRPAAARDDLREAVGGRRRDGGAVRRRVPRLARGGRRRLDRAGRGEAAREPHPVGCRTAARQGGTVDERPRPRPSVPRAPTPAATGVAARRRPPRRSLRRLARSSRRTRTAAAGRRSTSSSGGSGCARASSSCRSACRP